MQFSDLKLIEPLLRAVAEEGYTEPTPVQAQAIPHVLTGRDLLGIAQTGTGKTAAFALPILQRLVSAAPPAGVSRRPIRVLVLTPTRELASQIGDSFKTYGRHVPVRHTVVFGGVGIGPQRHALADGVDVLVATPGRLLDLMGQRCVHLQQLEIFVLDEADRMLDMGFLPAVKRVIAALPKKRQTLFFSATMPDDAQRLADNLLHGAARVEVAPPATTAEKVAQSLYFVERGDKQALLEHLLDDAKITRALVFTRTKHGANKVVERLERSGYDADAIHANKSQRQRERALAAFKSGMSRVLVATDIAARGIDVDGISHVINFDLPNIAETYVHRIGRTARAGAEGAAISFCDHEERAYVRGIEREIRMPIPVVDDHPFARGRTRSHHAAPTTPAAHWLDGSDSAPAPNAAEGAPTSGPAADSTAPAAHPTGAHRPQARPSSTYGRAGRREAHPYRQPTSVGSHPYRAPQRGGSGHGRSHGHASHGGGAPHASPRTTGGGGGGPAFGSGLNEGGRFGTGPVTPREGSHGGGPHGAPRGASHHGGVHRGATGGPAAGGGRFSGRRGGGKGGGRGAGGPPRSGGRGPR